MAETVLVTYGAEFVASHVAGEPLRSGYRIRALDDLSPQVHDGGALPAHVHRPVDPDDAGLMS